MQLEEEHIAALDMAEKLLFHFDFCPYFELKRLLQNSDPMTRRRFCSVFTKYYALNAAGLTEEFKGRFFEILFEGKVFVNGQLDYASILLELSAIRRRKGDSAMQFSFVSKLVAMHVESSPIYDSHVIAFFKEKTSSATVDKMERIAWYVDFLDRVGRCYAIWSLDERVAPILKRLISRDPQLAGCHAVRLMDFLIWKIGSEKLMALVPKR